MLYNAIPAPKLPRYPDNSDREGLLETPARAAKATQYLCHGYGQTVEEIVNGALPPLINTRW